MKILITGHRGFIGQNLVYELGQSHDLTGYDWDPNTLPKVEGFDWVIHLGAISSTTERNIDKILTQNYEFSKWLYTQCSKHNVNFQYASSASVYGNTEVFVEDCPVSPQSPYAWSKYLFDRWMSQQEHQVIAQGFRYFNVYGQFEGHKKDQASPVHKFTKQAMSLGKITLFEGSKNYKRDFVCAKDVCEIHSKMLNVSQGGIWNIGTGTATSFQYIGDLIAKKYNADIEYIEMPRNLKDQYQKYTCADITKLSNTIEHKFIELGEFINGC